MAERQRPPAYVATTVDGHVLHHQEGKRFDRDVFVAGPHHMETAGGAYLDLLDPQPAQISLDDIAHHLAQINRYTGAARRPMSVAEHAVLVADRLRSQGHGAATIMRGLHHDDAEAYVGDVGRPLKLALGSTYGDIEARVDAAIASVLGLPTTCDWEAVKAADDWALAAEAWHLLPSRGEGWFCWGLYDADDRRNPPSASRLRFAAAATAVNEEIYLDQHKRWATHLKAVTDAR